MLRMLGWSFAVACLTGCSNPAPSAPFSWMQGAATQEPAKAGGKAGASPSTGTAGSSGASTAPGSAKPAAASGNGGSHAAATSGGAGGTAQDQAGSAGADTTSQNSGASGSSGAAAGASGAPEAAAGSSSPAPRRSTGPGDWKAGDYPDELGSSNWIELKDVPGQNNNVRQFKVHVPPMYDPAKPMPVVFCIHGLGQDGLLFCREGASMPTKSDAAGFILVMPNGVGNSWNAGTCCGDAIAQKLDEIAFFRAMFAELSKHLNIDLTRVFATGLSNGGYMSYRLACEAADLFTAVAPGAGAIGMNDIGGGTDTEGDLAECKPAKPVSVLHMHGTEDPLIAYKVQKLSLDRIAMLNGCRSTTQPAKQPASAGDTTCISYDGCPEGVDVTGCSVQGGGHVWFGSQNCGTGVDLGCDIVGANSDSLKATDSAWEFLNNHPRL
ncbi:MAG TPA: prolyl oligopeptidase family serine peptidase [Polyangiales bacterium]|nr:prolyl oligopeptidase family serine peptidase [Polyangiales bacterium]